jgi:MFS family permease
VSGETTASVEKVSSNVKKFYLFAIFFWLVFWQPIIVLFWLDNGVSLSEVFLLKGAHGFMLLLAQIPSGTYADRFGKRKALLLATMLSTASLSFYVVGDQFLLFLIAELLAAVATSLLGASDSPFLYDTLDRLDRKSEFGEIMGRAGSLRFVAQGLGGILGGLAAGLSFRLTFALTFVSGCESPRLNGESIRRSYLAV